MKKGTWPRIALPVRAIGAAVLVCLCLMAVASLVSDGIPVPIEDYGEAVFGEIHFYGEPLQPFNQTTPQ